MEITGLLFSRPRGSDSCVRILLKDLLDSSCKYRTMLASQIRFNVSTSSEELGTGNSEALAGECTGYPGTLLNRNEKCFTHWRMECKHSFYRREAAILHGLGSDKCAGPVIHTAEGANLLNRGRSVVHLAMSSTSPTGPVASDAVIPCLQRPDRLL
jgi:hypothetical protein